MAIFVMLQYRHRPFCKIHSAPLITSSFLSAGSLSELIVSATTYRTYIGKTLAIITMNHVIVLKRLQLTLVKYVLDRVCYFLGEKKIWKYVQIVPRRKSTFDFVLKLESGCLCASPAVCLFNLCSVCFIEWNLAYIHAGVSSSLVVASYTTTLFSSYLFPY